MATLDFYSQTLSDLAAEQRLRQVPGQMEGGMVDLTSNDYLGLASDPRFEREFLQECLAMGLPSLTSSASRLLAGRQREYADLESALEQAYGKAVLLYNSGYHANVGSVSALADSKALIVSDKLVHASIIDGIRLAKAPFRRFAHNDIAALRRILEKEAADYQRVWVIVESVYSMDGDLAPLREIVALKREFPQMLLYVDEAHAIGVRGSGGLGLCEELGVLDAVDLLVGTFGKALASEGAFVATHLTLRDFLVNCSRSFIFSTCLPPFNASYTRRMFETMRPMTAEREKVRRMGEKLSRGLEEITGRSNPSQSQIVPWIVGSNEKAVAYAKALRARGFVAMPIRKPTVAAGTERIRFSLSAALDEAEFDRLLAAIKDIARD